MWVQDSQMSPNHDICFDTVSMGSDLALKVKGRVTEHRDGIEDHRYLKELNPSATTVEARHELLFGST